MSEPTEDPMADPPEETDQDDIGLPDELPAAPTEGFVRIHHAGIDADADIPEAALDLHRSQGWEPVDTEKDDSQ